MTVLQYQYCLQYASCLFLGTVLNNLNKCRVAPVNVKVDTDNDNNMEAIKPKPLEGIREQNI